MSGAPGGTQPGPWKVFGKQRDSSASHQPGPLLAGPDYRARLAHIPAPPPPPPASCDLRGRTDEACRPGQTFGSPVKLPAAQRCPLALPHRLPPIPTAARGHGRGVLAGPARPHRMAGAEPGTPPSSPHPVPCQPRRAPGNAGLSTWAATPKRAHPRPGRVPRRAAPLPGARVGESAPHVPEEAAVADDATTPLAHGVRQGIRAEEQLSGAQLRQGAQPVSPVGGAELFHLRGLHHLRSARQPSAASGS